MGRKKLNMAWISNNALRRATFRKRKSSLIKKVDELSTLCGVKACAIIYNPMDQNPEPKTVWPSEEEAKEIMRSFMAKTELKQGRKKEKALDQEGYLRQSVEKLEEQARRIVSDNAQISMKIFLSQCVTGERSVKNLVTVDQAEELLRVIEEKMELVKRKISDRKGKSVITPVDEGSEEKVHQRCFNVGGTLYPF